MKDHNNNSDQHAHNFQNVRIPQNFIQFLCEKLMMAFSALLFPPNNIVTVGETKNNRKNMVGPKVHQNQRKKRCQKMWKILFV